MKKELLLTGFLFTIVLAGCGTTSSTSGEVEHNPPEEDKEELIETTEEVEGSTLTDITEEESEVLLSLYEEGHVLSINNRDAQLRNDILYPGLETLEESKEMLHIREEVQMYIREANFDVLYANEDEAIILASYEFRQDLPLNTDDNWNSNSKTLEIARKHNGEWKIYLGYTIRQYWVEHEVESTDYAYTDNNEDEILDLVEQIKAEGSPISKTIDSYNGWY